MTLKEASIIVVLCVWSWQGAYTQHVHHSEKHPVITDSSTLAFIESVRQATEKYQDIQAAIMAGYRPIGPDMPNMGQHWIHTEFALRRQINPGQPGMLTYLRVDSLDILTGVAFTQPVLEGEAPPELNYQGASWHFHFRELETEAIRPPHMHDVSTGPRLAMLHAWVWADNPDGVFAADNWALPFIRLGLDVPQEVTPAAAKALFLLDGGVDFYVSMAGKVGGVEGNQLEAIRTELESAKVNALRFIKSTDATSMEVDDGLSEVWSSMRVRVADELGQKLWKTMGYVLE